MRHWLWYVIYSIEKYYIYAHIKNQLYYRFMKTKNALLICGLVSIFGMLSCNSNRVNATVSDDSPSEIIDTMKLNLDFTTVDTLKILYTANEETQVIVQKTEIKNQIEKMLTHFMNDTVWNNSGIMVKMVAPDYMLVLHHTMKSGLDDNWVSIWKELGKAKMDNKWYLLPDNKEDLFRLLDQQK